MCGFTYFGALSYSVLSYYHNMATSTVIEKMKKECVVVMGYTCTYVCVDHMCFDIDLWFWLLKSFWIPFSSDILFTWWPVSIH